MAWTYASEQPQKGFENDSKMAGSTIEGVLLTNGGKHNRRSSANKENELFFPATRNWTRPGSQNVNIEWLYRIEFSKISLE